MTLNKIFNEKFIEQLAWRGYLEYLRHSKKKNLPHFHELSDSERTAWIMATEEILEMAVLEVKHKLEM